MTFKKAQHALAAAIAIAALTLAGAPFAAHATAPHAGTITLGFFGPLSGGSADAGKDMLNAMKLAVDITNKAGGVLGEQLAVDPQDSPCDAQVAVSAAQKLVTDGVVAVIGPYCSGDAIPASAIYARANLPFVDPDATNPKLTQHGYHNIFRTIGRDDQQGTFAAIVMTKKFHAKRVVIIHDNTTYAKGLATYTQTALAKYPGVKVVDFDAIVPGSRDFSAILTKIKSLNPDVTYFTGYYADGGLFVKQFLQLKVSGQIMCGDGNNSPGFIQLAGPAAEHAFITGAPIPQFVPSAATFVKQFTATYHIAPGAYSAYTYDATMIAIHAIKLAKSTNSSAIIHVLSMTKNYPGVTGPITFSPVGDRVQIQYVLATVRKGQFVPVGV